MTMLTHNSPWQGINLFAPLVPDVQRPSPEVLDEIAEAEETYNRLQRLSPGADELSRNPELEALVIRMQMIESGGATESSLAGFLSAYRDLGEDGRSLVSTYLVHQEFRAAVAGAFAAPPVPALHPAPQPEALQPEAFQPQGRMPAPPAP